MCQSKLSTGQSRSSPLLTLNRDRQMKMVAESYSSTLIVLGGGGSSTTRTIEASETMKRGKEYFRERKA